MKLTKLFLVLTSMTAVVFLSANLAFADDTADLAVSVKIKTTCTISTSPVTFPDYEPIVTHATDPDNSITGGVTIACSKGSVTPIGLGLGSHADGTTRRMANGSNYLNYELYKTTWGTDVWGDSGSARLTPVAAPDKTSRTFTVYGQIASGQDTVPVGDYSDIVLATVNF